MFFYAPIWGGRLPDKVLCLTFDDGPDDIGGVLTGKVACAQVAGPQTLNLAKFLHEQGVPATFFVLGDRAKDSLDTLMALRDMGHLIANHTDCHPNLVRLTAAGVNPVPHVLSADMLIRNALFSKVAFLSEATFFRPPYGRWRHPERNFSQVADPLNKEKLLSRCIGPIHWDIDSRDWACWRDGVPAEICAKKCLEHIEKDGKGIVLMHDSNFEDGIRSNNNTYAVCQIIIPELQKRGYRFIRLDAVPQVASAVLVSQRFSLKTLDNKYFVSIDSNAPGNVLACATSFGEHEEFGLVDLDGGQIAIRVFNGEFLSVQGVKDGYTCTLKPKLGTSELFQMIRFADNKVAIKVAESEYFISLSLQGGIRPVVVPSIDTSETFFLDVL